MKATVGVAGRVLLMGDPPSQELTLHSPCPT